MFCKNGVLKSFRNFTGKRLCQGLFFNEVVKPLVYRQWKLRHVTLVKSVNTTASIRTTHRRSFHKIKNVLSENLKFRGGRRGGITRQSFHICFIYKSLNEIGVRGRHCFFIALNKTGLNSLSV